jgi:hypothetical protein
LSKISLEQEDAEVWSGGRRPRKSVKTSIPQVRVRITFFGGSHADLVDAE